MRVIIHHNRRNLKKPAPVEFEIYFSRTDRVYISTKIIIESKFWDDKTKEVNLKHPDHIIHNLKIKALKERIYAIEANTREKGETLSGDALKSRLTKIPPAITFNDYFERQIEVDRYTLKESTYRRIKSVLKNFNNFRIVSFADCDTQFIREYHNHLLKTMQRTTTPKNHKVISKYMRRAVEDNLLKKNPYVNFKIPPFATRRVFLTADELESIRTKNIKIERLAVVRDMFIFMCNTGMEYSDMMKLTSDDITEINENKYIIKSRVKVEGEIQAIPLFPEALEIINKYSNGTGFIFPRRSNQRLNSYLTEIAAICSIEKPLSTIVARHTFATLLLTRGMPLESVSHILGHTNTKTTRIYAKMIISKIENDLSRLGIDKI